MISMHVRIHKCTFLLQITYDYGVIMFYSRESKFPVGFNDSWFGISGNLLCPLQHFCTVVLEFLICTLLDSVFNQVSSNVEVLFYFVGTVFSSVMNRE
jgi:hypothetical protein